MTKRLRTTDGDLKIVMKVRGDLIGLGIDKVPYQEYSNTHTVGGQGGMCLGVCC